MSSTSATTDDSSSHDARRLAAWSDFLLASTHVQQLLERTLRTETGVSFAQFSALDTLRATGGSATVNQIGEALLYGTGSVTNLLKAMERDRLVTRARSMTDRRVVHVEATPAGRAVHARASELVLDIARQEFTELLTDEDLPAVARLLARMSERDSRPRRQP